MKTPQAFVRRALSTARRLAPKRSHIAILAFTLGLAATPFVSAGATTVRAANTPDPVAQAFTWPDPDARLQIILRKVHIYNDRDGLGAGELHFAVSFCAQNEHNDCYSYGQMSTRFHFSADSGDDVALNRVMPGPGDELSWDVTQEAGVPVGSGDRYRFQIDAFDSDWYSDEHMGKMVVVLAKGNNWSLGTFTYRSVHDDGTPGDYSLTYEVRRTPLPNLYNRGIHIGDLNGQPAYCGTVLSAGDLPSGPARLTVKAVTESSITVVDAVILPSLEEGQSAEHCVPVSAFPTSEYQLIFWVDEPRILDESNENDNIYMWKIPAVEAPTAEPTPMASPEATPVAPPAPVASPAPTDPARTQSMPNGVKIPQNGTQNSQAGPKADLTVQAIKVNGQAPDGKSDCKPGQNAVTVVVKNGGKGDAGSFAVRLSVDGDDLDATVDSLGAGQEREVGFSNVQLKKGQHTLKAIADPEHAVSEGKDDNNALNVTARCTEAAS